MLYMWNSKFELGVPEVDDQHRLIFALANDLHEAGSDPDNGDLIESVLIEMSTYVDEHFGDEEAMMFEMGYPAYEEHCQIHQEMQAKVRDLVKRYERDEVRAGELHVLVVSWLVQHITKTDFRIAEFLKAKGEAA